MSDRFFRLACALSALLAAPAALAQNPPVAVAIDAAQSRHPISPLIYGVAFGAASDLEALNAPLNRSGGNSTSTYNWKQNAQNLASDWYFESYPQASAKAGQEGDSFIAASRTAGALPMLTVPMLGWVAKLGPNRAILPSFSVKKYGAQCSTDPYDSDAGDGLKPDCATPITGNAPRDAYVPNATTVQQPWVKHLVQTWGGAGSGGLRYYILDNEPSIWSSTHRDIQPIGPHATAYRDDVIHYSAMVKATDPQALVVAPEEWGWDGYFYSGYDQQYASQHGWSSFPDRSGEEGGEDYIPWLLQQWKAAGHPIDVLSVHFYPQGGEYGDDVSTATQLLRNRSTRQLWDPSYVSESWIGAPVYLIPRLQAWIASNYYAGTPVAITEYNWGAEANINGATTQADIDGIFGQQGLNMATRWTVPASSTPTYKAMQIYRNYDGHHSTFGDTSVSATVPQPDDLSAFAGVRALDGALTVVVISKVLTGTTPVTLSIANFAGAGAAKAYQLTSANTIASLPAAPVVDGSIVATLPPQSVTLYVLPSATQALAQPPTAAMVAKPETQYAAAPPAAVNYEVKFASTGSAAAPGQSISGYVWDFGDGTGATGVTARHSYTSYGFYTAQLTVAGSNGLVSVATAQISVLPQLVPVTSCSVAYTQPYNWDGGFTADVKVTNTGATGVAYWAMTWTFPGTQSITGMWNASYQQAGQSMLVLPVWYDYPIAAGATVDFGFNANYSGGNTAPATFTLNGTACTQ
jgi:PKD repeat protein